MIEKGTVLGIGSDHAGYELKELIKIRLKALGYDYEDFGTFSTESVDYPDFASPLAASVEIGLLKYGILICGTGNGMVMTANKYRKVRAALCWKREIAALARSHNDANILVLPARFIIPEEAMECVEAFLETPFEGGRHQRRVEKIGGTHC